MNDRDIMENVLLTTKGVCDLYMHGTIESCTANVHKAFGDALGESLGMQDNVYGKMAAKGWYQTTPADRNKIQTVKQKFTV